MLEDKLAQRRKRRMEELEQKQMHETKVTNFLNCSQISCLKEPETQASMDTFFTRKLTKKRVRKSSAKELFFFVPVTFTSRGEWIKTFSHILDLFQGGSRFWKKLTHYLQGNGTDVVVLADTDKMKKPLGFGRLYFICSTPLLGSGLQRQNLSGRRRYRDDQETRARENGGDEGGWVANRWWNGSGMDTLCRCWHHFKYEQFAIRYFCLLKILTN